MNINIRLAKSSDALDMAEVCMRSWEAAYKDIMPVDYIREKNAARPAMFARIITDENDTAYVIQLDNKTVGIIKIAASMDDDADENTYEIHYMYMHPDYFRMGIGTKAMDFAFNIARSMGKNSMTVWVLAENINSIKFYEKCGYAADGKEMSSNHGREMLRMRMKKDLSIY